jgi:hypothetical protein
MSTYAIISEAGVVGVPRPESEKDDGSVEIPDWVRLGDTTPDEGQTFYRNGQLVAAELKPITKLALKKRVTAQEWAAIIAAIASDASTQEDWNLATEIDPSHPQTAAMIAALRQAGHLTTPLWKIFAQ